MATRQVTDNGTITTPLGAVEAVHCAKCQYDLRGQSTDGKCPECGLFVVDSLNLHLQRLTRRSNPLDRADTKWLRSVRNGVAFALIALVLFASFQFLPNQMYAWRSKARVYTLAFAIAAWTIAQYSSWKIFSIEGKVSFSDLFSRSLLVLTSAWLSWPGLHREDEFDPTNMFLLASAAALMSFLVYWRLAKIAWTANWTVPYILFAILALVTVMQSMLVLMSFSRHGPIDSLSQIGQAPSALLGDLNSMRFLPYWYSWRPGNFEPVLFAGTALLLLRAFSFGLLAAQLHLLICRRGRPTQDSPERTAASSRP